MSEEPSRLKDLFNRWISGLRYKASKYEHPERERGEIVVSPDLDTICNEMEAYLTGVINQ